MFTSLIKGVNNPCAVVGSVADNSTWNGLLSGQIACSCDLLELRLDGLPAGLAVDFLPADVPVLLTCRHRSEGGLAEMSEQVRMDRVSTLLPRAAALDWEIAHMGSAQSFLRAAKEQGVCIVASAHDFSATPDVAYLQEREREAREMGADIVKFAFRLQKPEDMMTGVRLLQQATGPMAVMGMGDLGPVSRLLYAQLGSVLVYGYLGNTATAPGQWAAAEFRRAIDRLSPAAR